jgi:hypothetical protein
MYLYGSMNDDDDNNNNNNNIIFLVHIYMKQCYERSRKSENGIYVAAEHDIPVLSGKLFSPYAPSVSTVNIFNRTVPCNQYGRTSEVCAFLVHLSWAQNDGKEQYADIDSEEETEETPLQVPSCSEENYEDFKSCHLLPSDKHEGLTFIEIIVLMGHNCKPSMKLSWTKDELYCISLYASVMPHDTILKILKNMYFTDNQNPSTQDREVPDYNRL